MSYWWFIPAIALYMTAAVLILIEVFWPTRGIISLFALASIIGGVAIFFKYSILMGWVGIIVAAVLVPCFVISAYKIFPRHRK